MQLLRISLTARLLMEERINGGKTFTRKRQPYFNEFNVKPTRIILEPQSCFNSL